jgi:hypothetical protein
MKKLALVLALLIAAPAFAEQPMVASHITAMERLALSLNLQMVIEPLAYSATTTTWANNNKTAIMSSSTGTESAPSTATAGLPLDGITAVSVVLSTASNATAGGTLQAYVRNVETGNWGRVPDLDLTAIAATTQSWPAIYVPVSRGRVAWVPNGIGSVTPVVYIIGQSYR